RSDGPVGAGRPRSAGTNVNAEPISGWAAVWSSHPARVAPRRSAGRNSWRPPGLLLRYVCDVASLMTLISWTLPVPMVPSISRAMLAAALAVAILPAPSRGQARTALTLDEVVASALERHWAPGAVVAVVLRDSVVLLQAWGRTGHATS